MVDLIDKIVYAGRLKEKSALMISSSGGAFTAVVYNYENHTAEFQMILHKEQREKAKGSKYMKSRPGDIYSEAYHWLMENLQKELLFVGMGCQADEFSELKGIRDRVYIVDIICHGSPSPKLWREYAASAEKRSSKITHLTFKDKRNGWKKPTAFVKTGEKELFIRDWVNIFYSRCALRVSCYKCPYATTVRKADLTIGGFWHIEEKIPDFYDPNGNSLFLIYTNRGLNLFEKVKDSLDYRLSDTTQCWQTHLEEPTSKSERRDEFWNDYKRKGIDFIMKKYGTLLMKTRIKNKLLIMGGHRKVVPVMLITPKGGQHNELEAA